MEAPMLLLLLLLLSLLAVGGGVVQNFSLLAIALPLACLLFNHVWLKPQRIRWKLQKQGIRGPQPSLLYGNATEIQRIQAAAVANKATNHGELVAHDYVSTLFPYLEQWRKEYGQVFTYSTGNKQHLYVNHPELVKEMTQSTSLELGKPTYVTKQLEPMLGNGILRSNGQFWARQRKIIAPEFFMDKVKVMVGLMLESAQPLLRKWEGCIDAQGGMVADIRVDEDLRCLSADVISRACFGSSYSKGKLIFSKLRLLQKTISIQKVLFGVPTFGFFRTRKQREMSNLEREIESLIWEAVKEREQECFGAPSTEKDLMQMILEGATVNGHCSGDFSSKSFIVDNCKNIYFAGHETTAVTASWCLMLLAHHPDWQARVREETAQVCQGGLIDAESLSKMKMVTMVIQEALRLYSPASFVSREALDKTQIGHISVPKGVCTWTLIPTLHRDTDIWGPDANEFKPERFANGVSGACKIPQTYVPFGLGPRLCLGRNFAMVELKIILALLVSKFTFSLSPNYRHSPAFRMLIEPGDGLHILIRRSKLA